MKQCTLDFLSCLCRLRDRSLTYIYRGGACHFPPTGGALWSSCPNHCIAFFWLRSRPADVLANHVPPLKHPVWAWRLLSRPCLLVTRAPPMVHRCVCVWGGGGGDQACEIAVHLPSMEIKHAFPPSQRIAPIIGVRYVIFTEG